MSDIAGQPPVTEQPLLIYSWFCPYVHRVTLTLAFKQASISQIEIDLSNKPEWLTKYSPHGKVPAITYVEGGEQQVLYESLALLPWVDEYYQGPALQPASPAQRTKARIIISRFDGAIPPAFFQATRAQDVESIKEPLQKLQDELAWLEAQIQGPFVLGAEPSIVDAAIAPWLLRAGLLKHFKNIDVLAKVPKLKAYVDTLTNDPRVATTFLTLDGSGWQAWSNGIVANAVKRFPQGQIDLSAAVA